MSIPPSLNTIVTNSTSTTAASDVFARAPPQQQQQPPTHGLSSNHHPLSLPSPPLQQQQQQQQQSFSITPEGGVDMELAPRTYLPTNTGIQQQQQNPLPSPTMTSPRSNTATTVTTIPSSSIIGSSLSPSSFLMDMNKSLDDLADEFLIGPNMSNHHHSDSGDCGTSPPGILLTPEPLPAHASDYERLRMLLQQRAYMDVLLYTRMLLEGSSSHYTSLFDAIKNLYNKNSNSSHCINAIELALDTHKQDLVNIMTIHITAMMKLSLFHELTAELDTWSFCYHIHQYRQIQQNMATNDDTGTKHDAVSWIPWTFHILAASTLQFRQLPHSTSKIADPAAQQDCLDTLFAIRTAIADTTNSNDTTASLLQVENTLHNVYLSMKNYRMALQCIQRMISLIPNIVQEDIRQIQLQSPSNEDFLRLVLLVTYQTEYLSRQGRILLQLGVLDGANLIFDQIKVLLKDISLHVGATTTIHHGSDKDSVPHVLYLVVKAQVSSNDGLLKFSRGKYEEALESFNTVVQGLRSIIPNTSTSTSEKQRQPPFVLESIRTNLYCETMNNMALCALYTCRLHEGIQVLESLIRGNVTANFNDRITLNLCTMYELAMDTSAALRKKKILQCIATRFLIQDIPIECFRIG